MKRLLQAVFAAGMCLIMLLSSACGLIGGSKEEKGAWLMVREVRYGSEGNAQSRHEYEYDECGNNIKQTYSLTDRTIYRYESEYDEKGRELIRRVIDGSSVSTYEYKYDDAGNYCSWTASKENGTVSSMGSIRYDENGNVLVETTYKADGRMDTRIEHEYDESGRETSYKYYESDNSIVFRREKKYDEEGKLIEERIFNEGMPSSVLVYEYDANGIAVKANGFLAVEDGSANEEVLYGWSEFVYDENGNRIEIISFDLEGGKQSIIKYEYEFFENAPKSKQRMDW
ncbi:MAG: hypothetical protein II871_08440 [Clostridia bacterium]|nr:hypothetical protein [Clostridia bacterium]